MDPSRGCFPSSRSPSSRPNQRCFLAAPQDNLGNEESRQEIFPSLDLTHIVTLLERFEPDEYSSDLLPTNLLHNLRSQVLFSITQPSSSSRRPKQQQHGLSYSRLALAVAVGAIVYAETIIEDSVGRKGLYLTKPAF